VNESKPTRATARMRALARTLLLLQLLAAPGSAAPAAESEPALNGVVNVNTATSEELELLPGIGPSKARAILEARERSGGFKRLEDLEEVTGIGSSTVEQLRPFATVSGKTTARLP
jgi:competence protein ComEA